MDKELIEKWAYELFGFPETYPDGEAWSMSTDALAKFAAFVAEKCAKEADHWQALTERRGRFEKDGAYIAAAIRAIFAPD